MTPIDYVKIDADILTTQGLSSTAKIILGMIKNYPNGLFVSNTEIGRLVGVESHRVSKIVQELIVKGFVRAENNRSKYRRLFYIGKKAKVDNDSTLAKKTATLAKKHIYFGEKAKHNIRRKETESPVSFSDPVKETPREYTPAEKEKIHRALVALDYSGVE